MGLKVQRTDNVGERIFMDGNSAAALGCVYGGARCAPGTRSALVLAGRELPEILQQVPGRHRNGQEQFRDNPGRGRACLYRMVIRRRLEWRARLHGHLRPRHFPDDGIHRPGLFRRDSGDHHQRTARRSVRPGCRPAPSRPTSCPAPTRPTATPSTCFCFRKDPKECFDFAAAALDLADRLQTPVFLMTDLDIGMNTRLCAAAGMGNDARRMDRGQGDEL